MKNVYLLVTDLHYNVKKDHRLNYFNEVLNVLKQVLDINQAYKQRGFSTKLIFMGDVIDASISTPDDAMRCVDTLKFVSSCFDETFTVLGNHEQHNISGNPFWFLVSAIEDDNVGKIAKAIQPKSINDGFRVPDYIEDGNTKIYFNHFGVAPKVPEGAEVNIGLFHQNVGSNDICRMWGTFDNVEEASYIRGYQYSFFGHMHLAVGKYYIGETNTCVGEWLGTCVGTNVTEVETLTSDLNIPAILIEDGVFSCIEDNQVKRIPAAEAIDYTKLELTRNTQKLVAKSKEIVMSEIHASSLLEQISASAEEQGLGYLFEAMKNNWDMVRATYKRALDGSVEILTGREEDAVEE